MSTATPAFPTALEAEVLEAFGLPPVATRAGS